MFIVRLFILAWALFLVVAAGIHLFFADGGTASVASLPTNSTLIGIFAWAGATQMVWALIIIIIAVRYQKLISVILLLLIVERSTILVNALVFKPPSPIGHLPPEVYITMLFIPLALLAFIVTVVQNKSLLP